ncbi:RidA family protein [Mesorhizobium sp. B2-3-2]|nr:RidA family protein [Mesorhizobium sp. B2-3-2]
MRMQTFSDIEGSAPQAVRAGDLVFIGGLMATDANGDIVAADIAGQARVIFERLAALLAQAGATMADVVKHNIYFSCDANAVCAFLDELDAVRAGYFTAPGPTTTEIRCGLDREGALLMVDAWVVVGGKRELLDPPGHWRWRRELPFVHGWKVGDMLFIGGQRSLDADGKVLGLGDIEVQTEEAFRNLDTMLRQGGGDRHSLMRQNTYFRFFGEGREVTDYWEKMTSVRRRYMSVPSAAGAGLRIQGMGNADELIQVEGIGMLGDDKQRLQPANHWDWSIPNTQFTQGWKIAGLAFIGGQISADDKAQAVGEDMETQARNVFEFIRRTLAEGGLDESDVAKLYIYYHAEGSWAGIEATRAVIARVQREFYPEPGPAVTAIRVAGFAFENLLVEIEAMAVTRG